MLLNYIGLIFAALLVFLPTVVYVVRRKDYDGGMIFVMNLALLAGAMVAGFAAWFLFGKENMWIGYTGVWLYGMYVAMKKVD